MVGKSLKFLKMGSVFNHLTIVGIDGNSMWADEGSRQPPNRWKYWCRCDCSSKTLVSVRKSSIISGHTKSCGCVRKEKAREKALSACKTNPIEIEGNITKVFFFNAPGEYTIIDTEDYDKVKDFCWSKVVGKCNAYARANTKGRYSLKNIRLHQVIQPCTKKYEVDHKDGNGLNNRKNNLRIVTHQENIHNQVLKKTNTSGVTGVRWDTRIRLWHARIGYAGKSMHLGYFTKFEDACQARWDAEDKYQGDYSRRKSRGEDKNARN